MLEVLARHVGVVQSKFRGPEEVTNIRIARGHRQSLRKMNTGNLKLILAQGLQTFVDLRLEFRGHYDPLCLWSLIFLVGFRQEVDVHLHGGAEGIHTDVLGCGLISRVACLRLVFTLCEPVKNGGGGVPRRDGPIVAAHRGNQFDDGYAIHGNSAGIPDVHVKVDPGRTRTLLASAASAGGPLRKRRKSAKQENTKKGEKVFRERAHAAPGVDHCDLAAAEDVPIHYAGEATASSIGRGRRSKVCEKNEAIW